MAVEAVHVFACLDHRAYRADQLPAELPALL
jgi:hypothetical protein